MAQLLVRAGQVVLPTGTVEADVLVEREKIRAVASNVTDTG
jgi:dihydroorotase-like cyclic amidohydrolase